MQKTKPANNSFPKLLEQHPPALPKIGDNISGSVLIFSKNEILIDLQGLGTGIIRGQELVDLTGELKKLKTGNSITATVIELENEQGQMELSLLKSSRMQAWKKIKTICEQEEAIEAKVINANKGGVLISVLGIAAFLPVSHLSQEHYPRVEGGDARKILKALKKFVGSIFKIKILNYNKEEGKVIVSERAAYKEKQKEKIQRFKKEEIVQGRIKALTKFGAFVDLGNGLEGLIHISELGWQKVKSPEEIVKVGDLIKLKILNIEANGRIFLSLKALKDNPWENFAKKNKIGDKIKGKIIRITPFGLLIEISEHIQGLVHISLLKKNDDQKTEDVLKEFKQAEEKEFEIVSINPKNTKLALKLINK